MVPIFFINLDKHPHRRVHLEKQLTDLGLSAERVSGIDGRNLTPEIAKYFTFADYLSPGQVGCFASHLSTLRLIRDRGIPAALILEDDAIISPELKFVIAETVAALPAKWDVVRLCRASTRAVAPVAQLSGGRQLVRYSGIPVGSAGYLVSESGAIKLLRPRYIDCANDVEISQFWRLGLNVYGVDPPPITQERIALKSTIGVGRRWRPSKWRKLVHKTARAIYNVRQLGPYWWVRCSVLNATRHIRPLHHS